MGKGGSRRRAPTSKPRIYPGLQKPVDEAINEAQKLYKGGWNQAGFNPLQTGAFQGAQNLLGQLRRPVTATPWAGRRCPAAIRRGRAVTAVRWAAATPAWRAARRAATPSAWAG
jgi:hypothetical protein